MCAPGTWVTTHITILYCDILEGSFYCRSKTNLLFLPYLAVLYYIYQHFICWDFVGMTIQDPKIVGMDPNCLHPKPRPSTIGCWDFVGITITNFKMGGITPKSECVEQVTANVSDFHHNIFYMVVVRKWPLEVALFHTCYQPSIPTKHHLSQM